MEDSTMGMLWLMIFSVGTLVMIVYIRKYANMERMALIEKGEQPFQIKQSNTSIPLRFSLLLIGLGLGLLLAYIIEEKKAKESEK